MKKLTLRLPRKFSGSSKSLTPVVADIEYPAVLVADDATVNLAGYIEAHRDKIEAMLTDHGGVLCRSFGVKTAEDFSHAISKLEPDILNYTERSSPRHSVGDKVYTSTDHPCDQSIVMHSEQSYTLKWPCLICFFCQTKSKSGGNTPIANNRHILSALPETTRQKFMDYGVLYSRVYSPGLGVDWRTAFQTGNTAEVAAFCRERNIYFEWESEDRLKTSQLRSAFQKHPQTGELTWFNHALFFHVTSLDNDLREALIEAVGIENVPTNTFFGDGSSFNEEDLSGMRAAVQSAKTSFEWEEGDVLILDNMLSQHGRDPFLGTRKVLTLMARPYTNLAEPMLSPFQEAPTKLGGI